MSYETNPYYSPENVGLRTIGEAEFSDGCYAFDTTVVWQHLESGKFYLAEDAGCSCPSPFDGVDLDSMTEIKRLQDLIDHLDQRKEGSYRYSSEYNSGAKAEIDGECADLIRAYREARA